MSLPFTAFSYTVLDTASAKSKLVTHIDIHVRKKLVTSTDRVAKVNALGSRRCLSFEVCGPWLISFPMV